MNSCVLPLIDYSQYGQALILEQLITPDIPKIVVDIGAHDGVTGSNSRHLLERGWRGVLVEPMPAIFASLEANSARFPDVSLANVACSDRDSVEKLKVGKDGEHGQMSSLSTNPYIQANVSDQTLAVRTMTLGTILTRAYVPLDFGVLLIDTEGHDFVVLQGLLASASRPRIIVTEDCGGEERKRELLMQLGYRLAAWHKCDSFWVMAEKVARTESAHLRALPPTPALVGWSPSGRRLSVRDCALDEWEGGTIEGWLWVPEHLNLRTEVVVALSAETSGQTFYFPAWRRPRPDVVAHFKADEMRLSGFRSFFDVPAGEYQTRIIQQSDHSYAEESLGARLIAE